MGKKLTEMERNTPRCGGGDPTCEYNHLTELQEIKCRISKREKDICCGGYDRILTAIEARETLSKREKRKGKRGYVVSNFLRKRFS